MERAAVRTGCISSFVPYDNNDTTHCHYTQHQQLKFHVVSWPSALVARSLLLLCVCADNLPHKPSAKATSCFSPFSPSRASTALPRISTRPLNSIHFFKRYVVSDKL